MTKRVLMIAYHFPPVQGSSGVLRTLKFAQYLPEFGWEPIVLTVNPRAYEQSSAAQLKRVPEGLKVHRAFALDTARHLSLGGWYPRVLALPDRWLSWTLGAVPAGLGLIRRYRPQAIWSTYPVATAHLVGLLLQRLSGLPWVADFRDPMTDTDYPPDPLVHRVFASIEAAAVRRASRAVFTAPAAAATYRRRFPDVPEENLALIENGYDEEDFARAERALEPLPAATGKLRLVHSGVLYPSERDPRALFAALSELLASGSLLPGSVEIVLRATGHDDYLRPLVEAHGIGSVVSLAPPLPQVEALAEMLSADGLLLLQAANCNEQIPAKLYEYLRARKPILALTDPAGSTGRALQAASVRTIAPLDSSEAIKQALLSFVESLRQGRAELADAEAVSRCSRLARTRELALLLDGLQRERDGALQPA